MKFIPERQEGKLERALNTIRELVGPDEKFLITFHAWKNGEIKHYWQTSEFPEGDLLICIGWLENEFMNYLKKKTKAGRMDP